MSNVVKLVSTAEELVSALMAAKGGETILLENGDYGDLTLDTRYASTLKKYAETVTIAALNPGEVTFGKLDIQGAQNLAIEGIDVTRLLFVRYNSTGVEITNCDIGSLITRDSTDLTITNNSIGGGQYGVVLQNVDDVTLANNYIHEVSEDLIRLIGGSSNILIENNFVYDTIAATGVHADLLQIYGAAGASPENVIIRGNIFYDDPTTGSAIAQGIFLCDAQGDGFKDILIEQNLVSVVHSNSIYVQAGGENVDIIDNTLLAAEGSSGAQIRVAYRSAWTNEGVTIEGNVVRNIVNEGNEATVGDNYIFGVGTYRYALNDQTDIFQSPTWDGWESFLPVTGSAIDFGSNYGAQERLLELLAGVSDRFGATRAILQMSDSYSFQSASSWISVAHDESLALDEASVALRFSTNTTSGLHGILSKDSGGLSDGLSVFIQNGALRVRFEDDNSTQYITYEGLSTHTNYDLVVTFGNGTAEAWLDGVSIGSLSTGIDWSDNSDALVLGAFNNNSTTGTTNKVGYVLNGTVSDLRIYDTVLEDDQIADLAKHDSYVDALLAGGDQSQVAYYLGGMNEFTRSTSSAIVVDPGTALDLTEGTVVMNFNPDATSWYSGLLSLNSKGSTDGFSILIYNGSLVVRFQDDDGYNSLVYDGLSRYGNYSLVASFEDGKGEAWLNGEYLGSVDTDMDWTQNEESLVIGAINSSSDTGTTSKMTYALDGTINGVLVLNEGMTATEAAAYIDAHPTLII